ncbi:MAG: hypothetical protein AAGF11_28395 [Myxococcota bacterium]
MADELLRALGRRQAQLPNGVGPDLRVPSEGAQAEGAQAEGAQAEGAQAEGAQAEGAQAEGAQADVAQADVAQAMLRPFEAQERALLLDGILDQLDSHGGASTRSVPEPEPEPELEGGAAVVSLASRRRSRVMWIGIVTAVAAALLLWVGMTPDSISPASGPLLPPYAATRLGGGTATLRSADAGIPGSVVLAPDASIDWIFTPRSPVRTPVGVVLLATSAEHDAILRRPEALEVSREGVVRISGRLTEVLPLSSGTWSIVVVLGDPAALPQTVDAVADGGTWSRLEFEVKITAAH